MRIEVFIDDESVPRQTLVPPATLELDTEGLADGPHRLRVHAIEDSGAVGVEVIPFTVRNGPGIAVVGLSDGETVRGRIPLLVNAFASRPGDTFEPQRAETPAPIPTWAWVLFLVVVAWGMWYVATELRAYQASQIASAAAPSQASIAPGAPAGGAQPAWAALGEQVYGNKCSACHQLTGEGLPGVFPPLKGSAVVTGADPTEHIRTVLHGLSGKAIGGVTYGSAMPAFADQLSDEEVAAVLSYERTAWGNQAKPVKAEEVVAGRK
jgi:mono/diheme cytochrome c family protein